MLYIDGYVYEASSIRGWRRVVANVLESVLRRLVTRSGSTGVRVGVSVTQPAATGGSQDVLGADSARVTPLGTLLVGGRSRRYVYNRRHRFASSDGDGFLSPETTK